jgi:hypothetical protein
VIQFDIHFKIVVLRNKIEYVFRWLIAKRGTPWESGMATPLLSGTKLARATILALSKGRRMGRGKEGLKYC